VPFPESVLITWVYNNTHRSTLSAVLLHSMTNFTGVLLGLSDLAEYYWATWKFVVAAGIVLLFELTTL
jgi:membrane protease YdiL (CAAX protease family)